MGVTNVIGASAESQVDWRKFDVLARDGGKLARRGHATVVNDFEGGLGGFAPHFHFDSVTNPPTLTNRFPFSGNTALALTTTEEPANKAAEFRSAMSYCRGGFLPGTAGLNSLSAQFALRGSGSMTAKEYPIESAWFGMDSQNPEGTSRIFGMALLRPIPGDPNWLAWYLRRGKTSSGPTGTFYADQFVKVPGSERLFMGLNENKPNYFYTRLTVDKNALYSGSANYYQELQLGRRVFDLEGLTPTPYDLVLDVGSWDHFSSGDNIGCGITAVAGKRARMNVDMVVQTVGDVRA